MQVMKAYVAETSYIQLLIDFATSLLTIHLPVLNNAAVSLYDMGEGEAQIRECSGMAWHTGTDKATIYALLDPLHMMSTHGRGGEEGEREEGIKQGICQN